MHTLVSVKTLKIEKNLDLNRLLATKTFEMQ